MSVRRNHIIKQLKVCGADSPETAKTLSEAGVINPNGFKRITDRLVNLGEIKRTGDNRYYV